MYKLVASDMDETFLGSDHEVPQANIKAIRELRRLGCLFVPASGRAYGSVMESLATIPPELLRGSYVISYNGGCLNRVGDPEPLSYHTLPHAKVDALYRYGIALGCVSMHVYEVSGKVWAWHLQPEEVDYLAGHMGYEPTDEPTLDFLADVPLAKMLYCIPDGADRLRQVEKDMPQDLKAGTSTTFSSGRYLEFNPEGVDKGAGLRKLAELLGIDLAQTIAVGDAANDASMVEAAGVGVCVANARDGLDQVANYRAASTNDDGVLKEILEKIVRPAAEA
jgi:Cof subfamily protein (haloacid dehalogenase superfamily)